MSRGFKNMQLARFIAALPLPLALAACAGAKTTETGPAISADLGCGSTHVRSEDTEPGATPVLRECEVDTRKKGYEVTLRVDANSGDKHDESSTSKAEKFAAKDPAVTLNIDGTPLPTPTFTSRDFFEGKRYDAPAFVVPDTNKGKTLNMHVETTDSRGLKSNIIDLKVHLK